MMTPPYYALYAEICLWLGRYQQCINMILNKMNSMYEKTNNQSIAFLRNDMLFSHYNNFFNNETPYDYESASAIMYDYQNRQTNNLLKHFDSDYPNKYWLAPAEVAVERFKDNSIRWVIKPKISEWIVRFMITMENGWFVNFVRFPVLCVLLIVMTYLCILIEGQTSISCWRKLSISWVEER